MQATGTFEEEIMALLKDVKDPEIPVLTIEDLGIIRSIKRLGDQGVKVLITPTYSGCPAMSMIEMQIRATLEQNEYDPVIIETTLVPPWTTEWMSESAKAKLKKYGIAPPQVQKRMNAMQEEEPDVQCPHCGSHNTKVSSQFGSTPCKALYKCLDCQEPFDYFKCH